MAKSESKYVALSDKTTPALLDSIFHRTRWEYTWKKGKWSGIIVKVRGGEWSEYAKGLVLYVEENKAYRYPVVSVVDTQTPIIYRSKP